MAQYLVKLDRVPISILNEMGNRGNGRLVELVFETNGPNIGGYKWLALFVNSKGYCEVIEKEAHVSAYEIVDDVVYPENVYSPPEVYRNFAKH